MSVQNILDKRNEEIKLVHQALTHPAGFILDLFGGMLYVRSTMFEYEVGWEEYNEANDSGKEFQKLFVDSLEAATFFVDKRHQNQLGVDFEAELMKEKI